MHRTDGFQIATNRTMQRLTTSRGLDIRPRWSPDGNQIVLTSNRDGNYESYRMNSDGMNQRRLTNNDERDDYASWYPDGKKLVVVSEREGLFDLYKISAR